MTKDEAAIKTAIASRLAAAIIASENGCTPERAVIIYKQVFDALTEATKKVS